MNSSLANRLIGALGGVGGGLILYSILIFVISGAPRPLIQPAFFIGIMGFVFLTSALLIHFKKYQS
jgi:hypothetical protein